MGDENTFKTDEDLARGEGTPFEQFFYCLRTQKVDKVKEILEANPNFVNQPHPHTKQTPAFWAIMGQDEDINIELLKLLEEKGEKILAVDEIQQNISFFLARDSKKKVLEFLLSKGLNLKLQDSYEQTPLYYAAREGNNAIIKFLIDNGTDPNNVDMNGQTCMFYAAKNGLLNTVKTLIENGAKHDIKDKKKETAAAWARKSKNQELINYLKELNNAKKKKDAPPPTNTNTSTPGAPVKTTKTPSAPKKSGGSLSSVNTKRKKEKEEPKYIFRLCFTDVEGRKQEVTMEQFEQFKQLHPKVAELLMDPNKIHVNEPSQNEGWVRIAKKLLNGIWKLKNCYYFHKPVDIEALKCYDYPNIIKNPMDFGTIKAQLNNGFYDHPKQFASDMELVFTNCFLYNGRQSFMGDIASTIKNEYDRLYRDNRFEEWIENPNKEDDTKSEIKSEIKSEFKDMTREVSQRSGRNDEESSQYLGEDQIKDEESQIKEEENDGQSLSMANEQHHHFNPNINGNDNQNGDIFQE